jgi:hypothetical protein
MHMRLCYNPRPGEIEDRIFCGFTIRDDADWAKYRRLYMKPDKFYPAVVIMIILDRKH